MTLSRPVTAARCSQHRPHPVASGRFFAPVQCRQARQTTFCAKMHQMLFVFEPLLGSGSLSPPQFTVSGCAGYLLGACLLGTSLRGRPGVRQSDLLSARPNWGYSRASLITLPQQYQQFLLLPPPSFFSLRIFICAQILNQLNTLTSEPVTSGPVT